MNKKQSHDCMCKGTKIYAIMQLIKAIPEEIALYFDVSQKKQITASDQQLQEPYQPRWWCTCRSS